MSCTTPKIVSFKKGSTFFPLCTMPANGSLTDLVGVTIQSALMTSDEVVHPAVVTIDDPMVLEWRVLIADTSTFSLGVAQWDFKFIKDGEIFYTETVELKIVKNITP